VLEQNQLMGSTHVVFVPSEGQGAELYDTACGAFSLLGLHALAAELPSACWSLTRQNIQDEVLLLQLLDQEAPWQDHFQADMLSRALMPVFSEIQEASEAADLPACERLILIGSEDAAWVLHAFLCELDRGDMAPQIPVTLVGLGEKVNSLISQAVQLVYPEKLDGVKYLSLHGEVPDRESMGNAHEHEAMTCFSLDEEHEECIFAPTDWQGPNTPWYTDPATIASWIDHVLL